MILWKHVKFELHTVLKKTFAQLQPSLWQSSQSTELMCISTTVHLWRLLGHLARISAIHSPRTKKPTSAEISGHLAARVSSEWIALLWHHQPSILTKAMDIYSKGMRFFVQTCVFDLKDYYLTQKQGCTIDIKGPSPRPQARCIGLDCKFLYKI